MIKTNYRKFLSRQQSVLGQFFFPSVSLRVFLYHKNLSLNAGKVFLVPPWLLDPEGYFPGDLILSKEVMPPLKALNAEDRLIVFFLLLLVIANDAWNRPATLWVDLTFRTLIVYYLAGCQWQRKNINVQCEMIPIILFNLYNNPKDKTITFLLLLRKIKHRNIV